MRSDRDRREVKKSGGANQINVEIGLGQARGWGPRKKQKPGLWIQYARSVTERVKDVLVDESASRKAGEAIYEKNEGNGRKQGTPKHVKVSKRRQYLNLWGLRRRAYTRLQITNAMIAGNIKFEVEG